MNYANLNSVATWLELGAKPIKASIHHSSPSRVNIQGFSMLDYTQAAECGTVVCIAGACNAFQNAIEKSFGSLRDSRRAMMWLGLSYDQAQNLFGPNGVPNESLMEYWGRITPAWAARTIRHLMETGVVDWAANEKAKQ